MSDDKFKPTLEHDFDEHFKSAFPDEAESEACPFDNLPPLSKSARASDGVPFPPEKYDFIQLSKRGIDIVNRILENCDQVPRGYDTPCWEWLGCKDGRAGYGRVSVDGFTSATHRVVWACLNGYLPPKRQIDHKCNNPSCCRPSHLQSVTHKQNCKLRDKRAAEKSKG